MRALIQLMADQHGVASTSQSRALGISRRVERRLLADGTLHSPCPGVLTAGAAPLTFDARAMAAALAPGVVCVSHGAAARLHRLDGFERHDVVDVLGEQGANPNERLGVVVHRTRGGIAEHVVDARAIPVLSVGATLALLAPADTRLPRSWFQRIAGRILASAGIRLVDEYPVRDRRGILLAELDLADPTRKVGVECQSWRWHATPTAQHQDARRRGVLRQLGWEVVDVWWSDLRHPDRVIGELLYLLQSRAVRA